MAQTYNDIASTDTLSASRQKILDRDDALKSSFSGTAFPTTNLLVGMTCYRTDTNALYRLKDTTPTWVLEMDFSGSTGKAPNADTLDGYDTSTTAVASRIPVYNASAQLVGDITGNAPTASRWATARTISLSTDATGSASVDGSAAATIAVTLANSGVTAGSYTAANITVDAKGRITAASSNTSLVTSFNGRTGGVSLSYSDVSSVLYNGGSYWQTPTWIQFNGSYGLYWPGQYGTEFAPNPTGSYGAFAVRGGGKNGYSGFHFQDYGHNYMVQGSGGATGSYWESWGWGQYSNSSGIYSSVYGWLHNYFFSTTSNCLYGWGNCAGNTGNCKPYSGSDNIQVVYNCGNTSQDISVIRDDGSQIWLGRQRANFNCNCNCDCCCCFAPGTLVRMSDGTVKAIEDVRVGETVVGLDGAEALVAHRMETTLKSNQLFQINADVVVTGGHLFKVDDGWAALDMSVYPSGAFYRSHQHFENGELIDVVHQTERAETVRQLRVGDVVGGVVIESVKQLSASPDMTVHNMIVQDTDGYLLADGYAVDGFLRRSCKCEGAVK